MELVVIPKQHSQYGFREWPGQSNLADGQMAVFHGFAPGGHLRQSKVGATRSTTTHGKYCSASSTRYPWYCPFCHLFNVLVRNCHSS